MTNLRKDFIEKNLIQPCEKGDNILEEIDEELERKYNEDFQRLIDTGEIDRLAEESKIIEEYNKELEKTEEEVNKLSFEEYLDAIDYVPETIER